MFMLPSGPLREVEQAEQVVHELLGAKRGRLIVGTLSTVNSYLIAPLVSRFKPRFPNIHLQVHAQPSSEIVNGCWRIGLISDLSLP